MAAAGRVASHLDGYEIDSIFFFNYWLEDIDVNGKSELHGPIEVKLSK